MVSICLPARLGNPSIKFDLALAPRREYPPSVVGVEILAVARLLGPEAGHPELRPGPGPLADRAAIAGGAAEMAHRERLAVGIELGQREAVARLEAGAVPDLELQQPWLGRRSGIEHEQDAGEIVDRVPATRLDQPAPAAEIVGLEIVGGFGQRRVAVRRLQPRSQDRWR